MPTILALMTTTTMRVTVIATTNTTIAIAVDIVEAEQYCCRSRARLLHTLSRAAVQAERRTAAEAGQGRCRS